MFGLFCFILAVLASPFKSKSRLEAENAVQCVRVAEPAQGRARTASRRRAGTCFWQWLCHWQPQMPKRNCARLIPWRLPERVAEASAVVRFGQVGRGNANCRHGAFHGIGSGVGRWRHKQWCERGRDRRLVPDVCKHEGFPGGPRVPDPRNCGDRHSTVVGARTLARDSLCCDALTKPGGLTANAKATEGNVLQ